MKRIKPLDTTVSQSNVVNVSLKDFNFKRILGVGAFGAVWLVTKKSTNDEYALKIIDCSQQVFYVFILSMSFKSEIVYCCEDGPQLKREFTRGTECFCDFNRRSRSQSSLFVSIRQVCMFCSRLHEWW